MEIESVAQTGVRRPPRRTPRGSPIISPPSSGGVDPTENVKALAAAGQERQDDLSGAFKELVLLLDQRQDDLRRAEIHNLREIIDIHTNYQKEIREAEKTRINDIRAVDVGAVGKAAEVASAAASALATQLVATAEVQRAALASTVAPILTALESLRNTQFQQAGAKEQATENRGETHATTQSNQWLIGILIGVGIVVIDFISKKIS